MTTTRERVAEALSGKRYRYTTEVRLHEALAAALDHEGVSYEREVVVVGGRIDFLVERCGVEVKTKGSAAALASQLTHYAADAAIDEFLVVTTKGIHRSIPDVIDGKPVAVLVIGGLSL